METTKTTLMKVLQKDQTTIQTKMTELLNAIRKNKVDETNLIKSMDKHDHEFLATLQDDWMHAMNKMLLHQKEAPRDKDEPLIPPSLNTLFSGMARVPRDDFFQQYDTGVPQDDTIAGNEQVLLLYSKDKALPQDHDGTGIPLLSVENATE